MAASNWRVEQLMQKYEPREAIAPFLSSRPDEASGSKATLAYNKTQVQVSLTGEAGNNHKVASNTVVEEIIYNSEKEQASIAATAIGAWRGLGVC